jgi:nucleoside-diphosphate-sugar epimerase
VRDWIHIDDVVAGTMALVDANLSTPVNLCTGVGTSMHTLAKIIHAQIEGYQPAIQTDYDAPMGVFHRVGDPTKLSEFYQPVVSIEEGIKRALGRS